MDEKNYNIFRYIAQNFGIFIVRISMQVKINFFQNINNIDKY